MVLIWFKWPILKLRGLLQSKIIKHFFIYSFGSVAQKSVYIFAAPIIMRLLSPADYGLLSLTNGFINVLVTCVGLGLRQFLAIEYFHGDERGKRSLINDILSIYIVFMIPVFILLFFNAKVIDQYLFVHSQCSYLIIVSLLICFFKFFTELFYQIMQYHGLAFTLASVQVFGELFMVSLSLFLLYFFGYGVIGIFISQFASVFVIFLLALFSYIYFSYHVVLGIGQSLKKSVWYVKKGFPFIPRILFAWILAVGDRWVLAKYSTMANVGIYSVADMFGQVFQMIVILPVTYAYIPPLLKKFAANRTQLLSIEQWNQRNMFICMAGLVLFVTFGFFLFKPLLCIIIPPRYHASFQYVWMLLMGYIFLLGTHFASTFLHFKRCVYFLVFALCIPAALNIFLNILLIPIFHIWGCVFATVVSYAAYFLITLLYNWWMQVREFKKLI